MATDSDSEFLDARQTTMSDVGDAQVMQLQEQLVATMIENENIKAELTQYKDKNHVDEILRQLELEREKNTQLSIQLQQQISRSKEIAKEGIDVAEEAVEESKGDTKASVAESRWIRLQKYVVNVYHKLLADFAEEPVDVEGHDPDGDQLAVKQLKDNIKRFKKGIQPMFCFYRGVHAIFTYKSPCFSLVLFAIYMYSVWYGWLLPVILSLCIVRLCINSLQSQGWKIDIHFFTYPDVDVDKDTVYPELALSDKFNLVLQVARQVQNVLGEFADGLEKLKNLLTWRSPDASKQLLSALVVAFVLSSVMSGVALFRLTALYLGIKMFIIECLYIHFPRLKHRHDSVYRIWRQLPTDAVLEYQYKRSLVDRHIIISDTDGSQEVMVEAQSAGEVSDEDKSFCDVFNLPLSERPLPEWEDGWRVTIVDKEKPFLKVLSRTGRMYLTKSFLCVERYKFQSPKNIMLPLTNITSIEKAKPYSWLPGAGMSIQIAVVGFEQPYTFGAIINRDECFKLLMTHGARLQLPWAALHAAGAASGNSRSQSPAPDAPSTDSSPPPSAKAERTFRMSDLRDDLDDDDKLLLISST